MHNITAFEAKSKLLSNFLGADESQLFLQAIFGVKVLWTQSLEGVQAYKG